MRGALLISARHIVAAAALFVTGTACAPVPPAPAPSRKIAVDLANVNAEGLRGAPTGLRAVHYEFCVPAGERYAAEVRSIDSTVRLMPGSRGRIGCANGQVLVLGSTYQPAYRRTLERLAALDYIDLIIESFFE